MSEPEGLLIEGARLATSVARDVWSRVRPPRERSELPLARVRSRLELFLGALCGDTPSILPTDPQPAPTWLARVMGRAPRHLDRRAAIASTDGTQIWLPRVLEAPDGEPGALTTYRMLAVEQAARAARGTPGLVSTPHSDRLEDDLYLLAEAVAVDRALALEFPGLVPDLVAARRAALAERPQAAPLTVTEWAVERLVRDVLGADPAKSPAGIPVTGAPRESRSWARGAAWALRGGGGRYRGVATVALWGQAQAASSGRARGYDTPDDAGRPTPPGRSRSAWLRHRPRVRENSDGEDDDRPGLWMVRLDEPMESVEDPMGLRRPLDRDDSARPDDLADSLSELPEACTVRTPGSPREVLESDAGRPGSAARRPADRWSSGAGIAYPEWDYRVGGYRNPGAVVWPTVAPQGTEDWVERVMTRHAALVRRVRRQFDGLRPRRRRLDRQADGPELDLSAYVTAFGDRRAGCSVEDRFYTAMRRARRDLAIALLIDVSASTDSWVGGGLRIIDVEKEALIVLVEALHALGDPHAVLGFSGRGPEEVRLMVIKDFGEPTGLDVRRRIASLEPDRHTRTGAAIRHASMLLARRGERHRLLVILSDGKPNDVDEYEGRYGIEDTRQAVAEARMQGLMPFCLTVDREAPDNLRWIFGRRGHAVLRRPDLLPAALVEVVRGLIAT